MYIKKPLFAKQPTQLRMKLLSNTKPTTIRVSSLDIFVMETAFVNLPVCPNSEAR